MLFAGMLSYPVADVLCFGCSAQVSAEVGTYRFHSLYSCNQKRVVFGNLLRLLPDRWRLFVCLFWIRNRMCPTGSTHKGGPTHSKMSYQMIYFLWYFSVLCIILNTNFFFLYLQFSLICVVLEDQHMEWKPAGQPEHASLNQCQLIVANRCSGHPQQVVEIRFLCNVIDAGALIGPCSHVTSCCCLIC